MASFNALARTAFAQGDAFMSTVTQLRDAATGMTRDVARVHLVKVAAAHYGLVTSVPAHGPTAGQLSFCSESNDATLRDTTNTKIRRLLDAIYGPKSKREVAPVRIPREAVALMQQLKALGVDKKTAQAALARVFG